MKFHRSVKDFVAFYTVFMTKLVQDIIVNYFVQGQFKPPRSSTASSLVERISTKMSETFFGRASGECKPFSCLTSKSIGSNLACNNKRVSRADIVAEILKYTQLDDARTARAKALIKSADPANFLQCTLCYSLLGDHPDELKMHIVQSHVYNNTLNKCMVCCYCR